MILSVTLFWRAAEAEFREAKRSPWLTDLVEPVRLRELVQESLQRSGLTPRLHQGGDPHVLGDRRALGRAFDRLLSHATEVHLTTAGPVAELVVLGVGHDEFGFWVARKIVEAHGGGLQHSGAQYRLTLPLVAA